MIFSTRTFSAAYRMVGAMRRKSTLTGANYAMEESRKISVRQGPSTSVGMRADSEEINNMIKEYERFHSNWIKKMKSISGNQPIYENENGDA